MKNILKYTGAVAALILIVVFSGFCLSGCSKELKADAPITLVYDKIYIIGDASPAVWTIANAIPMTKTADNIFTWTGPLTAGEIKFPTALSFSSDTFGAATASQLVSNNKAQISPGGSPDIKWKLAATDAGNYKVTVNANDLTVTFVKQ